jgi:prevent-host-death family protein
MLTASHIKPISYLKANAAKVLRDLAEQREPLVITQNGEATAVLQDIASYEQDQQTLALLKILALGNQQIAQGRTVSAAQAIDDIRRRLQPKVQ